MDELPRRAKVMMHGKDKNTDFFETIHGIEPFSLDQAIDEGPSCAGSDSISFLVPRWDSVSSRSCATNEWVRDAERRARMYHVEGEEGKYTYCTGFPFFA
jgi:hypothetical protein